MDLNFIMKQFKLDSKINRYGNGHINDTFLVEPGDYILQRINTNIFKNPDELMKNIENVTEFIKEKVKGVVTPE